MSELPFLDDDGIAAVRDGIAILKRLWFQRRPDAQLFTLGASIYQDALANGFASYQDKARFCNPLLTVTLGWFYEALRERLQSILAREVRYHPDLALPGFHIMLADPMFLGAFADVHVDSQFALIDYEAIALPRPETIDSGHILSVTIAIDLPAAGGGLFHWDLEKTPSDNIPREELKALVGPETRHWYPYTLGTVVLHSGLKYHQIARWDAVQPDDARITLQGHAVLSDGIWTLYW